MAGGRPACTQISVAPNSTASTALLTISCSGKKYASISTPVREKAQNPHRFTRICEVYISINDVANLVASFFRPDNICCAPQCVTSRRFFEASKVVASDTERNLVSRTRSRMFLTEGVTLRKMFAIDRVMLLRHWCLFWAW